MTREVPGLAQVTALIVRIRDTGVPIELTVTGHTRGVSPVRGRPHCKRSQASIRQR
jgi:hypothetical protein